MAVVKGSPQQHLKIVSYNPAASFFRKGFYFLLIIASLAATYFVGSWHVTGLLMTVQQERDSLFEQVEMKDNDLIDLNQRVAVLEEGSKLDKQSSDDVRESVKDYRDRIADLEKEVTFYKNIMAPAGKNTGLHIQKLELQALANNNFKYKIVLTQREKNQSYVSGQAAVSVIGQKDGQKVIYSLKDLSKDQKDLGVKFRFRYFQNIVGDLTLPDGFKPEEMQIILQTTGKKPVRVEQAFTWTIGESINNVGQ